MKTQQNEIAEFAYQFFTNTYSSPQEAIKQGSDAYSFQTFSNFLKFESLIDICFIPISINIVFK